MSDKNCSVHDFYLAFKRSIFYAQPFYPVLLYHELVGAIRIAPNCQNSPILSKDILVGTTIFNLYSINHLINIRMKTRRRAAIVFNPEPS